MFPRLNAMAKCARPKEFIIMHTYKHILCDNVDVHIYSHARTQTQTHFHTHVQP